MANWDWQVFCKDTIDGEVLANCWGSGGKDISYLHWMIEAWAGPWRCRWSVWSSRW